jgi:DNA-directed RNA polymerase subunit K/omega
MDRDFDYDISDGEDIDALQDEDYSPDGNLEVDDTYIEDEADIEKIDEDDTYNPTDHEEAYEKEMEVEGIEIDEDKPEIISNSNDDSYYYNSNVWKKVDVNKTRLVIEENELVSILGIRVDQLYKGAFCFVDNVEGLTPEQKAIEEVRYGVCPMIIRRFLPNNEYVDVPVRECKILFDLPKN